MPIPQNAEAIWTFLIQQGFSSNAAAGILGNIEQESGGDPESPSGGLIQILGNAGGTLAESLAAMMTYIKANGSVANINANASSPSAAALYFSNTYERPNAALANNANREQSADDVLAAAKSGNWQQGSSSSSGNTTGDTATGIGGLLSWPSDITGFFDDAKTFLDAAMWLVKPSSWVRIGSLVFGLFVLGAAFYVFTQIGSGQSLTANAPKVVPVPV
jgi:hypothetical protein